MRKRTWRAVECLAIFGVGPLAIGRWIPPRAWLPTLWIAAAATELQRRRQSAQNKTRELERGWSESARTKEIRSMALRVAAAAVVLGLVFAFWPSRWLQFPRQHFWLWLLILAAYPWVSVYPQELIYRRYFIFRYGDLFGGARRAAWASAFAFGFMHVMFRNVTAPILATVGGLLFARTYVRSGSLAVTCFEHSVCGAWIFTFGLGEFFYDAAVKTGQM